MKKILLGLTVFLGLMFPLAVNAQGRHGHGGNFHGTGGFHHEFNHDFHNNGFRNNHFGCYNNPFRFHNRTWWVTSGCPIYLFGTCYYYYYDGCYYPAYGYDPRCSSYCY